MLFFFVFKQKTAYDMRISDWSSDVCSSDLVGEQIVVHQVIVVDAEQAVDDRDRKAGAILARDTVDKAGRVIFGERGEIKAQRRDERGAVGIGRAAWRERGCK